MKSIWFVRFFLVLLAPLLVVEIAVAQSQKKPAAPATPVAGSGCLKPGVERGCMVLTDKTTGKLYNLFFLHSTPPALYSTIKFSGRLHEGPTICMQGQAVEVERFARISPSCDAGEKTKKK